MGRLERLKTMKYNFRTLIRPKPTMNNINLNRPDDWDVFAGGTGAAEGRNSYSKTVDGVGKYFISPVCRPNSNRHLVYFVTVCNIFGRLNQSGLYHWLISGPTTLPKARSLCNAHYLEHMELTKSDRMAGRKSDVGGITYGNHNVDILVNESEQRPDHQI